MKTMINYVNPKTNPQRDAVLRTQLTRRVSPNSKLMWDYKNSLPNLDKFQQAICVGLLLGDVSIASNQSKTNLAHKLKFEWGGTHHEYALSVYDSLRIYCLSAPRTQKRINVNDQTVTSWCFQTVTVPVFNNLGEAFLDYSNNRKTLNLSLLDELLTAVSLAYRYIDDGHCGDPGRYGLYVNTQAFTEEEVQALCRILINKFDIDCWSAKKKSKQDRPYIVISGHSYNTFFSCVELYIHPSIRYKFPKGRRTQWSILSFYIILPLSFGRYVSRWHSLNCSANYRDST